MEVLEEKDAKLQLLRKKTTEVEFHHRIQQLEHKNALQEKDLRIKELELQISRQKEESTSGEMEPLSKKRKVRPLLSWISRDYM